MIYHIMFSRVLIVIGIIAILYAAVFIYSSYRIKNRWEEFLSGFIGGLVIILVGVAMAYFNFDTNLAMIFEAIFGKN